MKKTLIYTAFAATAVVAVGIFFASCESNEKKVEDAQDNVKEAKQDLKETQRELSNEYPAFRTEGEAKIVANEKRIAELREKLNKPGKAPLDEHRKKKIEELEQQNAALRSRLGDYEKQRSDWETFKREFNHDMDGLGKSFEDLGKDNKN